jgi:hypothetical protein
MNEGWAASFSDEWEDGPGRRSAACASCASRSAHAAASSACM